MRIRSFFLLLTATISGLLILIAGTLILDTTRMYEKANLHARALESISVAQELKLALLAYSRDASLTDRVDAPHYLDRLAVEKMRVMEELADARRYVTSEEEDDIMLRMDIETKQYLAQIETSSPLERTERLDRLIERIDSFIGINRRQASDASQAVTDWDSASNAMGKGVMGIVLLIGAGTMLFFRRLIYLPLKELNGAIGSYARGEIAVRAAPSGPLEIREIGAAFNEMANALAESRQRQLQFLAGVVHDLKNPLTAMKGYTDLLLHKNRENEEIAGSLKIILSQIDRLNVMLHDLVLGQGSTFSVVLPLSH